jgi:hypothetical protein
VGNLPGPSGERVEARRHPEVVLPDAVHGVREQESRKSGGIPGRRTPRESLLRPATGQVFSGST